MSKISVDQLSKFEIWSSREVDVTSVSDPTNCELVFLDNSLDFKNLRDLSHYRVSNPRGGLVRLTLAPVVGLRQGREAPVGLIAFDISQRRLSPLVTMDSPYYPVMESGSP